MQRFFIVLSFAIMCSCNSNKPVPAGPAKQQTTDDTTAPLTTTSVAADSAVALIRVAFQKINSAQLKKETFKWTADNCNNEGTATYYLNDNNQILKVVETGSIGDGSWSTAYYYEKGKFIFSLSTDVGGPAAGPDITTINRKYVYDDVVVRTMENDTYTTGAKEQLIPSSREYKILQAYKSKDFGNAFCE